MLIINPIPFWNRPEENYENKRVELCTLHSQASEYDEGGPGTVYLPADAEQALSLIHILTEKIR